MLTFVVYDVSDDKIRTRLFKALKQAGLLHIQKSVFLGNLENASRLDELATMAEAMIEESDACYLIPVAEAEYDQAILLGIAFDRELAADRVRTMIF